jgi:hypothetical protein
MATVTKGRTFTSGETVTPAKLNDIVDLATVTNIQTADIGDGQVTNAKLATGIEASKLTIGTLPIDRIAAGAVTGPKLADGMVVQVVHTASATGLSVSTATAPLTAMPTTSNATPFSSLDTTITPKSSTNKVLVSVNVICSATTAGAAGALVSIFKGSGSTAIHASYMSLAQSSVSPLTLEFLDSPATTSATTYKVCASYVGALGWNLNLTPGGAGWFGGGTSLATMTLTEIKAS